MRVEIWADIVCPWCYIGTARFAQALAGFVHRAEAELVYRSFELDPHHDTAHTEPVAAMLAVKLGPQGPGMDHQTAELARNERLGYRTDRQVGNTLDAHRLLQLAKEHGRQELLLALLFEANFAQARSVFTHEVLLDLASHAGLDADETRRVLQDKNAYLDAVRADEREAVKLGARGVPYFVINRRYTLAGAQTADVILEALNTAGLSTPCPKHHRTQPHANPT